MVVVATRPDISSGYWVPVKRFRVSSLVSALRLVSRGGAVAILLGSLATAGLAESTVTVLTTDSLKSTKRVISGLRRTVENTYPDATIDVVTLASAVMTPEEVEAVAATNPHLLVTIGTDATTCARKYFPDTPTVFASVLYPQLSGFVKTSGNSSGGLTGASLDIPAALQFRYFLTVYPNLDTIGLLYTDNTAPLVREARKVATDSGLTLIAVHVATERDLPHAVDSLTKHCSGIWSLADPLLFQRRATQFILTTSLKRQVPVMGFNRHMVESGALFALDFDYKAIGRQTGRIVNEILSGRPPQSIPVTRPDIVWFHYNSSTDQHLGKPVPDSLKAVAKEVYR